MRAALVVMLLALAACTAREGGVSGAYVGGAIGGTLRQDAARR